MMLSAEGILGYWDGTKRYTPIIRNGWDAFSRLQGAAQMAVLQQELAGLFQVIPGGAGHTVSLPLAGGATILTLTPPGLPHLEGQLPHVRAAADLRADRLPEILTQMGDMLSFYGAHFRLTPESHRWTLLLLAAAYEAVILPEMQLKFHASLPRPFDFAPDVQPVIQTPAHGTYPSGHATEAFAFAAILAALKHAGLGAADPVGAVLADLASPTGATRFETLPFRLAARIADNRTVAGVHFPVDSAHGALLGLSCGLAFLGSAMPIVTTLPGWVADGGTWMSDFTLDLLLSAMPGWKTVATVTMPGAAPTGMLATLFAKAQAEWV
jgi:hypothetical protein